MLIHLFDALLFIGTMLALLALSCVFFWMVGNIILLHQKPRKQSRRGYYDKR